MRNYTLKVNALRAALVLACAALVASCEGGNSEITRFGGGGEKSCTNPAPTSSDLLLTDVLVYGGTPSGIMAAVEAAHQGKRVILLEPSSRVGGKFGNGIGIGEIKNIDIIGGNARRFFAGVAAHYGFARDVDAAKFEPKVAGLVLKRMLCNQPGIQVWTDAPMVSVSKTGTEIQTLRIANGTTYAAKVFIDATYEGDLLAAAGVSYIIGRESNKQYNESLAGVRPLGNANNAKFDPYIVPGDPASGVLPLISATPPGPFGTADDRIMAYTYRICVTAEPGNRVPFSPPANYDPAEFEAVARMIEAKAANGDSTALDRIITLQGLPNRKFDVNNVKDVSVDYVGESYLYPEASPAQRLAIAAKHERFVRGFMYFLATSPRLPKALQDSAAALGYCKDEYVDNGNFPSQLYVRQARRMIGSEVMTQGTIMAGSAAQSIGLGVYWIDTHTVSLFANRGLAQAEGHLFTEVEPYQIPYGALTPRATEVTNLLVSVCISASYVAFASVRVEPSYMIMGQSAGAAAALAIDQGVPVQDVDYPTLSRHLLDDGQLLSWSGR